MPETSSRSRPTHPKKAIAAGSKQPRSLGKTPASIRSGAEKRGAGTAPSKSDQILKLLQRKRGASLTELQEATGWQAHSLRGFLSGTVKKRLSLNLQVAETEAGERRYLLSGQQ